MIFSFQNIHIYATFKPIMLIFQKFNENFLLTLSKFIFAKVRGAFTTQL